LVRTEENEMLEMKLMQEKTSEDGTTKMAEYQIGESYIVRVIDSKNLGRRYEVYPNRNEGYIPEIYINRGVWGKDEPKFKIQTTSYGSLESEEIQKVIAGYNVAMETVELIKKQLS